jgi:hypothetical protein
MALAHHYGRPAAPEVPATGAAIAMVAPDVVPRSCLANGGGDSGAGS